MRAQHIQLNLIHGAQADFSRRISGCTRALALMNPNFLDFEQPIAELEAKIEELRHVGDDSEININDEIERLGKRSRELTASIFGSLTPWQIAKLARHPQRPYTLDYLAHIVTDVEELHGDRAFGDDAAVVAGLARLDDRSVAFVGHQKGRNTKDNLHRNFGMPNPEGYRKAKRIMQLAERFKIPVLTFIDTPGAYPGIDAEERGQSEAIAQNLLIMMELNVPIVTSVIGEGGSGGALAIGVCDRLLMLEYATYAVISPEGCASILWKSTDKAEEAAVAMGITASRLRDLGLIDEVLAEPLGGAHRDIAGIAAVVKEALSRHLAELDKLDADALRAARSARFLQYGKFVE